MLSIPLHTHSHSPASRCSRMSLIKSLSNISRKSRRTKSISMRHIWPLTKQRTQNLVHLARHPGDQSKKSTSMFFRLTSTNRQIFHTSKNSSSLPGKVSSSPTLSAAEPSHRRSEQRWRLLQSPRKSWRLWKLPKPLAQLYNGQSSP
jgi:hypothetical protein